MRTKAVVTRKDHECAVCERTITEGTECIYYEGKIPTYDVEGEEEFQDGIEYIRGWKHDFNCIAPPKCRNGRHAWVKERSNDLGLPTGNIRCKNCGVNIEDKERQRKIHSLANEIEEV